MKIDFIIEKALDEIEIRQSKRTLVTGIPTGFNRLDQLTTGFQKSNLITICGATGMGKRALAYNLVRNAAIEGNLNVGVLNLSLSYEETAMRFLCSEARVDSSRIRSGYLSKDDWKKLTRAAVILTDAKIEFYGSLQEVYDIGCHNDLIIIDSFQRLPSENQAANITREQISYDIVNKLKNNALLWNTPIILLSSLNDWKIERRADKRPRLTDFKYGYTSLPDISDIVITIYRDEVYNQEEDNPNRGTAEIRILKQRCGPTGTAILTYLNSYCRFEDLADEPL